VDYSEILLFNQFAYEIVDEGVAEFGTDCDFVGLNNEGKVVL